MIEMPLTKRQPLDEVEGERFWCAQCTGEDKASLLVPRAARQ
jgi:hypothetical protein